MTVIVLLDRSTQRLQCLVMWRFLFLAFAIGCQIPAEAAAARPALNVFEVVLGQVISVYDGDTITVVPTNGRRPASELRVRISNIDTPEVGRNAQCAEEDRLGRVARAYLAALIGRQPVSMTIDRRGLDRYGRTLARVSVAGIDVGEALVRAGLARRWDGRRRGWC